MRKLLVRLRRRVSYLISRSVCSTVENHLFDHFRQGLSVRAETHLPFAGISRQMEELNFSVFSVALW